MLALLIAGLVGGWLAGVAQAHEGPDPVAHWFFTAKTVAEGRVKARLGPDGAIEGAPRLVQDKFGSALRFDGVQDQIVLAKNWSDVEEYVPSTYLTVAVWATVEEGNPRGALVSCAADNGDAEKGWLLGYNDQVFRFVLSALGTDDGNGQHTVLEGRTRFEPGRYYHLVATYDGVEMRLYVNGKLDGVSTVQTGPIIYPRTAPFVIGANSDGDESTFHKGLIRDVSIYDIVATEKWALHDFEHGSELVTLDAAPPADAELAFLVTPYLQFVDQHGITVMCETNRPAKGRVVFGLDEKTPQGADGGEATIHEIRLNGLEPQTGYFYRVEATDDRGRTIRSPLLSFQTANREETPFAFGIIADTQWNPRVCKVLSDMMWMQRPNFLIVPGDLVDAGPNKRQWTHEFFPGMNPLISRVAFFPVLGNHEQNAKHYYDYMSLPDPEYYYTFHYGNAQFFMVDSNKEVGPGSEQWNWLERELSASRATWKFVSYHHPSYSSDEDDYGDMWRGRSTHGDLRIRELSKLYDKYGVDIVWNGHIHSYERTWPLNADRVVERKGTIYMVTGGGGGGLETAGPIKPYFQNNVKHGHHYCMVAVNGRVLEFKAIDFEGRLFDTLTIDKSTDASRAPVAAAEGAKEPAGGR